MLGCDLQLMTQVQGCPMYDLLCLVFVCMRTLYKGVIGEDGEGEGDGERGEGVSSV